ncbi:BrnA antitoxin family protein [Donghicola sp. C2-DW-16]|uniref:BrnA antitoxin family protein n=1 Tax=Donghicola mangrovi TaxID=2729614 RepID=A0ABX2PGZ2_9RHOB|nr:BrnA antitoxin family protein [Donghicola mangrovi]NVO28267.1 BrnA antitoxin family protein [Donghicola mangrovi]
MIIPDIKTRTQRQNHGYLMDVLAQLEWDLHQPIISGNRIPDEWRDIYSRRHAGRKKKVTLWVEEDVVRFFKKQGAGYTTRMNDVLVAFMLARLSGLIHARDTTEEFQESGLQPRKDGMRPRFGDTTRAEEDFDAEIERRMKARRATQRQAK